jgi:hypothetical protein
MGELIIYDSPEGSVLNKEIEVSVRLKDQQWKPVECYTVKVDMHRVQEASMAYFDFEGEVEVKIRYRRSPIYKIDIRPLNQNIKGKLNVDEVTLCLDRAVNLSVEINGDRFHNLHLFAGNSVEKPVFDERVKVLEDSTAKTMIHRTEELIYEVEKLPKGRTIYFAPGVHYLEECSMRIPSDTNIYIAGGAIIVGTFIISKVKNVRVSGRGVLYLANFERFSGLNALRISHAENITIKGIHIINPPHYSVYIGASENILIEDTKTFSCEGWSDGIDIMSSRHIVVDNCFLRNSDDCIAIYGRRWDYNGDTYDIRVKNSTLWADVAHPTMIGGHGDYEQDGNSIYDIEFENIDILEHHEPQMDYLGCLAINAGDKNTVHHVNYKNIRIEHIEHGKVLDIQVKCNSKYNPAPGKEIYDITFSDIYVSGSGEVASVIQGYDENRPVRNIEINNYYRDGIKVDSLEKANIEVSNFAQQIVIK